MARYQPIQSDLYGNHVPYDQGTTVKTPDIEAGSGTHAHDWNVSLIDPIGGSILLWVHEVESSFQLDGQTAQSHNHRQFFPRNFAQPNLTVRGIVPNNYQYNRLASFVRRSQAWALGVEDLARIETMVTMRPGRAGAPFSTRTYVQQLGDSSSTRAVPTTQLSLKAGKVKPGRTHRGPHSAMIVEGYIKSITAGATRFEYAKEFEFDFTVSNSVKTGTIGLYEDSPVIGDQILTWMDLFKKNGFSGIRPGTAVNGPAVEITRTGEEIASDLGNLFG